MKNYVCVHCQRYYGGDCIADFRNILINPFCHDGDFYCGDQESGCYIPEEEVVATLGDHSDPYFYIQYDCCNKHDFLPLEQLGDAICSRCDSFSTCMDCHLPRRFIRLPTNGRYVPMPRYCRPCIIKDGTLHEYELDEDHSQEHHQQHHQQHQHQHQQQKQQQQPNPEVVCN